MNGLIPHTSLDLGTNLEGITVNNTYQGMNNNGFRARFGLAIGSNCTVWQLKMLICQQLSFWQGPDGTWQ